jgi:hypothetical protein
MEDYVEINKRRNLYLISNRTIKLYFIFFNQRRSVIMVYTHVNKLFLTLS